jgi:biotin carboxylase
MSRRILLLASTTGYQTRSLYETSRRLGFETVVASNRCINLEDPWHDGAIAIRYEKPATAASVLALLEPKPDGIVAVGDRPAEVAALAAEHLRLPFHPYNAVVVCRNKYLTRERFRQAGLLVPDFYRVPLSYDVAEAARSAQYPCVLKPLGLSASRGVIRVDDVLDFTHAFERIRNLLEQPDILQLRDEQDAYIQVESFVSGREFAIEGLLTHGHLRVLAIFDKPDPLDGPFFEETIYTTPSQVAPEIQQEMVRTTQEAVAALGLHHGPIHAEMRVNHAGVWMLEVAARPIGGICSQSLRFQDGMTLEELIVRHAAGEDVDTIQREAQASGVMMIPIPKSGIYQSVTGTEQASAVPGVTELVITAKVGQRLLQLPEGSGYLGFIFARSDDPARVDAALRKAHSMLNFEIATEVAFAKPVA